MFVSSLHKEFSEVMISVFILYFMILLKINRKLIRLSVLCMDFFQSLFVCLFVCLWLNNPVVGLGLFIVEVSRSHSFRHTTLGRTPLDE
jgi:hypothetical protein